MPTVRRIGAARFYFFSSEGSEPPHVHVEQAGAVAKFWLRPVSLARSKGFRPHDLRRIRRLVIEHEREFLEAWHEYFET
jgi:Domain of unknown function (DUF4160)